MTSCRATQQTVEHQTNLIEHSVLKRIIMNSLCNLHSWTRWIKPYLTRYEMSEYKCPFLCNLCIAWCLNLKRGRLSQTRLIYQAHKNVHAKVVQFIFSFFAPPNHTEMECLVEKKNKSVHFFIHQIIRFSRGNPNATFPPSFRTHFPCGISLIIIRLWP